VKKPFHHRDTEITECVKKLLQSDYDLGTHRRKKDFTAEGQRNRGAERRLTTETQRFHRVFGQDFQSTGREAEGQSHREASHSGNAAMRFISVSSVALWLIFFFAFAMPTLAQESASTPEPTVSTAPVDTSAISDDAVNAVAESLYCPVCENIPLDTCPTQACIQWREEIRIQLAEGQSEQQIISNFVNRYGDRVVGVPEDPALRALSLITPWLMGAVVLVAGVSILIRWRRGQGGTLAGSAGTVTALNDEASYRARLEADLVKRR
jgi:cytochrome c-type biogenesis protein CcmH